MQGKYKILYRHCWLLWLGAAGLALNAQAQVEHHLDWGTRARYAQVAADNSGQAASLLLRGELLSQWREGLATTLELDHIATAFNSDHNNGLRANDEPLIPDPPGSEINQAFIQLQRDNYQLQLGRQRINFDQQRFIGGNGFWQNEQTFDALLGKMLVASNSNLSYAYIANANRIFGDDADRPASSDHDYGNPERPAALLGDHQHHSQLARLEWNEWDYTRLVAYGYHIDNRDMPEASNNTLGLSYQFSIKQRALKYRLQAEWAQQDRYELDAAGLDYALLDLGLGYGAYELSGRYEILGAKSLGAGQSAAFITPLGSLHNFQGWADAIGNTPDTGIRDLSLNLLWRASPWRLETAYHFFSSDIASARIGRELDLDIVFKPARKHSLALRLAHFEPEDNSGSVRKLYVDYAFNL